MIDFPPNRTRSDCRQAACRDCYAVYHREYYRNRSRTDPEYRARKGRQRHERRRSLAAENRLLLSRYLTDKACVDCGEADPVIMEFDHQDPKQKRFAISDAMLRRNWPDIERELAKCEVRCANCHRRKTAREFGYRRHTKANGA